MSDTVFKNQEIHNILKTMVLRDFENIDIYKLDDRVSVYRKAKKIINTIHSKHDALSKENKNEHYIILSDVVDKIETDIASKTDEKAKKSKINVTLLAAIKSIFSKQNHRILLYIVALCSAAVFVFLFNLVPIRTDTKVTSNKFNLPFVLKADENLHTQMKLKDKSNNSRLHVNDTGILYEVKNLDKADSTKSLRLILKNELADKLNSIDEPFIVTLFIEKKSERRIKLNLLARGSGRTGRKNLIVADNSPAEYFVVVTKRKAVEDREQFFIRLVLEPIANDVGLESSILLSKITFTKL